MAVAAAAVLFGAGCGSSSKTTAAGAGPTSTASSPPAAATEFGTATVAGVGSVLVDASGKTVYLLTADNRHNVLCEDSTGCTKVWPDLPLPAGVAAAKAGAGVQASLLGTMKLSDGQTYPTYNGWLMYEYTGDSGPGQGHGEGIQSFGGTWYAISPSGGPVTAASSSAASPATTAAPAGAVATTAPARPAATSPTTAPYHPAMTSPPTTAYHAPTTSPPPTSPPTTAYRPPTTVCAYPPCY